MKKQMFAALIVGVASTIIASDDNSIDQSRNSLSNANLVVPKEHVPQNLLNISATKVVFPLNDMPKESPTELQRTKKNQPLPRKQSVNNFMVVFEKDEYNKENFVTPKSPSQEETNKQILEAKETIINNKRLLFEEHLKYHNDFDSLRNFILNPQNNQLIQHCNKCLEVYNSICSLKIIKTY